MLPLGFVSLFCLYSFVYFLCKISKENKLWFFFKKIVSTSNALQCICLFAYSMLNWNENIWNLEFKGNDYQINSLYLFSSYLFVDGIFNLTSFDLKSLTFILHHFFGGFGIYLIAEKKIGLFLGLYFAMTEISTPFLNLSWFSRKKIFLIIFYFFFVLSRIITIPLPLIYLKTNEEKILETSLLIYNMAYYGTYLLILLNLIWFVFLNLKLFNYTFCNFKKRDKEIN